MRVAASAAELLRGYEILWSRAIGEVSHVTPRGLAVLLRGGLVAWMSAYPPGSRPATSAQAAEPGNDRSGGRRIAGLHEELVHLLAEMALRTDGRCAA